MEVGAWHGSVALNRGAQRWPPFNGLLAEAKVTHCSPRKQLSKGSEGAGLSWLKTAGRLTFFKDGPLGKRQGRSVRSRGGTFKELKMTLHRLADGVGSTLWRSRIEVGAT